MPHYAPIDPEHDIEIVYKFLSKANGPTDRDQAIQRIRAHTNLSMARIHRAMTVLGVKYTTHNGRTYVSL